MMLDEFGLRLTNFDEDNSVPVVLADGQLWWFPKPWLEIRPQFEGGRATGNVNVLTYGPEIDALLAAQAGCEEFEEQMVAVASLAAYLLQWHYVLTDPDLDLLLAYRVGDAASQAWVARVIEIATGHSGPKRPRAGDA
jgi:hypothetical protein